MKKLILSLFMLAIAGSVVFTGCKKDDPDDPVDPGTSSTELIVQKFSSAPTMDGTIDAMWANSKKLVGTATVPTLAARGTYLNSDGEGIEENLGLFFPFDDEAYDFQLRAGYHGDRIYMLLEWGDDDDSKDRQSWYFDDTDMLWKQEHKYANHENDKFYEDKFAFFFPIGTVDNFNTSTCYAVCHQNLPIVNDKDKHTRHFTSIDGQKVDMWHWKRVRGSYADQVDDQVMVFDDIANGSSANGRQGDTGGGAGYSNNKQTLNNGTEDVSVPMYVIPGASNYYWISEDDITAGTAKMITAVDANGVLTYEGGGTIDPANGGFEQGTGNMRLPSVLTKAFTTTRADIDVMAIYTGSGWVCEVTRKLNTGDPDDAVFDITEEMYFGLAIFNNSAIAHGIKPNLLMKFEQ
jgi:hypothetical protein